MSDIESWKAEAIAEERAAAERAARIIKAAGALLPPGSADYWQHIAEAAEAEMKAAIAAGAPF